LSHPWKLFVAVTLMVTAAGIACARDTTVVVINARAGTIEAAYVTGAGRTEQLSAQKLSPFGGKTLTVRTSNPVKLRIVGFNTALFGAGVSTRTGRNPELDGFQDLLSDIAPYAKDWGSLFRINAPGATARVAELNRADTLMEQLRALVTGCSSVELTCYDVVSRSYAADPLDDDKVSRLRNMIDASLSANGFSSVRLVEAFLPVYRSLDSCRLHGAIREDQEKEVTAVLKDIPKVLARAAKLEAVAGPLSVLSNLAEIIVDQRAGWTKMVHATLSVTPTSVMSFAGLKVPDATYEFDVLPDMPVRPLLGIVVLHWSGADFVTYSTVREQGGARVVGSPADISRWTQGLSFGLAWDALDWRDIGGKGFAIALPDFVVNPFDKFAALGAGVGVSWSFLRLSVGCLWIRNTRLDGYPGQLLTDSSELRTHAVYLPRMFIGLSLVNLPAGD
jgi:hypothetical protein